MDIIQSFYNNLATHYDKLFQNWKETVSEQAEMLERILKRYGFDKSVALLDCACGIGTQSIGLALRGYNVTASDFSEAELAEAIKRADESGVNIRFERADFRELEKAFNEQFDVIIAMDNALPHMLSKQDLQRAVQSIAGRLKEGGIFVASIRDYDTLLRDKPPYSAPYIHKTEKGQRVSFQTWDWQGENYKLVQYIVEDEEDLKVNKFKCEYRATRRDELTKLLSASTCCKVEWLMPEDTGFYQPIVVAKK